MTLNEHLLVAWTRVLLLMRLRTGKFLYRLGQYFKGKWANQHPIWKNLRSHDDLLQDMVYCSCDWNWLLVFKRDGEWIGNLREEIDPLDGLQELDKWNSSAPFNSAHLSRPIPQLFPSLGLLRLQAKGAFCFTSEPGASRCASNIKIEPVLSVQYVRLYISGCRAAAMGLLCAFM